MDATYFRDKAETCLRLARGLSWNNPARGELMELAEEFYRQADEFEAELRRNERGRADAAVCNRFCLKKIFRVRQN